MNNQITSIQVLGSGCPTCRKLHELTKEAAKELGITTEVEYSSDIQKLLDTGMMSSPVLVINGKVALAGTLPNIEKIKALLSTNNKQTETEKEDDCCSCGGKC